LPMLDVRTVCCGGAQGLVSPDFITRLMRQSTALTKIHLLPGCNQSMGYLIRRVRRWRLCWSEALLRRSLCRKIFAASEIWSRLRASARSTIAAMIAIEDGGHAFAQDRLPAFCARHQHLSHDAAQIRPMRRPSSRLSASFRKSSLMRPWNICRFASAHSVNRSRRRATASR